MFALGLILGALLGLIAGFLQWWIVTRAAVPKVGWSTGVCRSPGEALEYRVKFGNLGRRDVVDVTVKCTVRVRNLDELPPGAPRAKNYTTIDIPLRGGQVDIIRKRAKRDLPTHIAPAPDDDPIKRNRTATLLISKISEVQRDRLPVALRERILNKQRVELEEMFDLGDDSYMDFTFYCYDGYTGARRCATVRQVPQEGCHGRELRAPRLRHSTCEQGKRLTARRGTRKDNDAQHGD